MVELYLTGISPGGAPGWCRSDARVSGLVCTKEACESWGGGGALQETPPQCVTHLQGVTHLQCYKDVVHVCTTSCFALGLRRSWVVVAVVYQFIALEWVWSGIRVNHLAVRDGIQTFAYDGLWLSIGHGQTS